MAVTSGSAPAATGADQRKAYLRDGGQHEGGPQGYHRKVPAPVAWAGRAEVSATGVVLHGKAWYLSQVAAVAAAGAHVSANTGLGGRGGGAGCHSHACPRAATVHHQHMAQIRCGAAHVQQQHYSCQGEQCPQQRNDQARPAVAGAAAAVAAPLQYRQARHQLNWAGQTLGLPQLCRRV